MHKTFIETVCGVDGRELVEWFGVRCERRWCRFSSTGHTTYASALHAAVDHEAVTPVPWYRRWRG